MSECIKSALHDATPSWNGFNYQGKVGLYVSLKYILKKARDFGISSSAFSDFLNNFSIEYEWIEDFAIKNNDNYISLHQVKHKAGTGFSDHIGAITTILNRKLCRLSETDFIKYITLNIDYPLNITSDEKIEITYQYIQSKMDLLCSKGYITADYKLSDNWKNIDSEVEGIDSIELKKLLTEFEIFTNQTFLDSKVYFHTAEDVSPPRKNIELYEGIPSYHNHVISGLRTLSGVNIFLAFDEQDDYILNLSDELLLQNLSDEVKLLLVFIHGDSDVNDTDVRIYISLLCNIIDKHVSKRHNDIRIKRDLGSGFSEQRDGIVFRDFFNVLNVIIRQQDKDYWENYCRCFFEDAYSEHMDKIEHHIYFSVNEEKNRMRKINLERYKKIILKKYTYSSLLEILSPDQLKNGNNEIYYTTLMNKDRVKDIFLVFIQSISKDIDDFIIKAKGFYYYPSLIKLDVDDEEDFPYYLELCKKNINNNYNLPLLCSASHLIIKTKYDLNEAFVKVKNIFESCSDGMDDNNIITSFNTVRFESMDNAIRNINND